MSVALAQTISIILPSGRFPLAIPHISNPQLFA